MIEHKMPSFAGPSHREGVAIETKPPGPESVQEVRRLMWGAQRNSGFSRKLLYHGMGARKSMEAFDRSKRKETEDFRKSKVVIDKFCSEFDDCVEEVRRLQQDLAAKQKEMALVATQKYSALCIQTAARQYLARRRVRRVRAGRAIAAWLVFKRIFKFRLKMKRRILRNVVGYFRRVQGAVFRRMLRDVCHLRDHFNGLLNSERQFIKEQVRLFEEALVGHMFKFGKAKAARKILVNELNPDIQALRANQPLNKMVRLYKRYKRMRFLRGHYGKLVFCALQQASEQEDRSMHEPGPKGFGENYSGINLFAHIKSKVDNRVARGGSPMARRGIMIKKHGHNTSRSTNSPHLGGGNAGAKGQRHAVGVDSLSVPFPVEAVGFYPITSIRSIVELMEDLMVVAQATPQVVDQKLSTLLYNSAVSGGVIHSRPRTSTAGKPTSPLGSPSGGPAPPLLASRQDSNLSQSGRFSAISKDKCFPTYCPPVGPFYMTPEQIEAEMARIYPNGYIPYQEPEKKKKKGRGSAKAPVAEKPPVAETHSRPGTQQRQQGGNPRSSSKPGSAGRTPAPPNNMPPSKAKGVGAARTVK